VLAFSDIIDFLLRLLSDEVARREFDRDPQGALDRAGLSGVTAQDVRDARLQLADSGAVHATDDAPAPRHHGDDPVHEIGHTAHHYAAHEDAPHVVDHGTTIFTTIDDRDTLFFQSISDDDVTVTHNSVSVADSFNRDDSRVTAIQANGSFNSDDDVTAIQDNDVNGGPETVAVDTDVPARDPTDPTPVPLPDADPPADPADEPVADTGADPGADDTSDPVDDAPDPLDDATDDPTDHPVDDPADHVEDAPDPVADDVLAG
jgi:hypothetical protein